MGEFKLQYRRLLYIDEKIRRDNFPNCTTIANEYEVSTRTIHRDIEYMRVMLDAPIEYDTSKRGYYYSEPNYNLPTIDIKESDFFAICIAEKALEQYANTPIYEKLSSVFDKLRSFLPENIRVNTSWVDTQYTFIKDSYTMVDPEIWETISQSLRNRKQLRIIHQKAGSESSLRRTVDPYHIANYRGEWYLICYCHLRKSVLRFAISRIRRAETLDRDFDLPGDFDFEAYMGSHFGIMTNEKEYTVKIRFSRSQAPYVIERTWHPLQRIKENRDGSIVLSFPTNSLFEVKRWVLSWGAEAKVITPRFLADQVKDELRKALSRYIK